jgi:ribosome-binding protein aMBF1 (putative translation factor)
MIDAVPGLHGGVMPEKKNARRLCEICGKPIAKARLDALPNVTTCIECAKKNPKKVDMSKYDLSESSPIDRTGFAPSD